MLRLPSDIFGHIVNQISYRDHINLALTCSTLWRQTFRRVTRLKFKGQLSSRLSRILPRYTELRQLELIRCIPYITSVQHITTIQSLSCTDLSHLSKEQLKDSPWSTRTALDEILPWIIKLPLRHLKLDWNYVNQEYIEKLLRIPYLTSIDNYIPIHLIRFLSSSIESIMINISYETNLPILIDLQNLTLRITSLTPNICRWIRLFQNTKIHLYLCNAADFHLIAGLPIVSLFLYCDCRRLDFSPLQSCAILNFLCIPYVRKAQLSGLKDSLYCSFRGNSRYCFKSRQGLLARLRPYLN